MIRTEPKFITPDDFENYWGVNLNASLKGDNYSNKANIFLRMVEDRIFEWIDAETFRVIDYDQLTDFQLEKLQKAILEQAMYVYKNSDIALDSGYDPDVGIVVDKEKLDKIVMCGPAINCLKNGGLYNQKITNRRRYTRFD